MELAVTIALFVLGLIFVIKGGDYFVDAASWIAEKTGVPKLIVGATIVSVATTLPEMLVSCMAAAQGKVDLSIGNAVGSVTANIGLIMAFAIIFMPGAINRKTYLLKSILMLTAAALIALCGFFGQVSIPISCALIAIFALFIWENIRDALHHMRQKKDRSEDEIENVRKGVIAAKFIFGAAGIIIGAQLLVDNGSLIAQHIGIPERVIGVTLVAVGTSLPELITTITAIIKRQSALSIGNILGANIIDLTLIMPLSSLIAGKPLPISPSMAMIDLPACLFVGLIAIVPAMILSKFSRWQGILLLLVYAGYITLTCSRI